MVDKTINSMCNRVEFLRRENVELKAMVKINEDEVRRLEYMIIERA